MQSRTIQLDMWQRQRETSRRHCNRHTQARKRCSGSGPLGSRQNYNVTCGWRHTKTQFGITANTNINGRMMLWVAYHGRQFDWPEIDGPRPPLCKPAKSYMDGYRSCTDRALALVSHSVQDAHTRMKHLIICFGAGTKIWHRLGQKHYRHFGTKEHDQAFQHSL